jgi:hypothetical protein
MTRGLPQLLLHLARENPISTKSSIAAFVLESQAAFPSAQLHTLERTNTPHKANPAPINSQIGRAHV